MPREIPLRSDLPHYDLRATLDDVAYTLELRWNARAGAWFLDVLDGEGQEELLAGLRAVVGYPVNLWNADRRPPGLLVFVDTTFAGEDPGRGDLGDRVRLWYFASGELV